MKIIFTGGGTGGHFYPIISIVEEIKKIINEKKMVEPQMYFIAPTPYDKAVLANFGIKYKRVISGKKRRYFSLLNFIDALKLFFGILKAIWTVFWIYPDVIFSKGGYGSIPTVFAGRILGIPIIIHESDSKPGKANLWASKFATKIAISTSETAEFFKDEKLIALTGIPIRNEIKNKDKENGHAFFNFDKNIPTILVWGGSQGSEKINDAILDILPNLMEKYQVIHQTGKNNFNVVQGTANVILEKIPNKERYRAYPYLNDGEIIKSAGAADIVISRAGSTSIAEIANWGLPSIMIPIPESVSHDQRSNAFNYARYGATTVIEENNLTSQILLEELNRIIESPSMKESMIDGAQKFSKPDAGKIIANEIIEILLSHQK